eukprot:2030406-Amphidinium_carterae.1
MELLEPSLVNMMQYVKAQAQAGDLTASTVLEECVASLEVSKEADCIPPEPLPLVSEETKAAGDQDEDMVGDQEPSQKKPRGMGAGTPSVP